MKKSINKIISLVILISIGISSLPVGIINASVRPSVSISAPNKTTVEAGGTVTYTVSFADNVKISRIHLSPGFVELNGFTANISVSGTANSRMVTLSNIQGENGKKTIVIRARAAEDEEGNYTLATPKAISFTLVNKVVEKEPTQVVKPNSSTVKPTSKPTNKPSNSLSNNNTSIVVNPNSSTIKTQTVVKSNPKIINSCNDTLEVLGDINKKVAYFSTWLTSQRNNIQAASQNNIVAENQETTYFVDYYNGSKKTVKDVKIKLVIPYNVDVLEINANGYIKTQTAEETVIEWDKSSIQSKDKCRLAVKVKYLENILLEESDKISEEFYVTLKAETNSNKETSYLRQLFVDTNANKKATVTKYLSTIDNTNSIRPDDKITRAELAKLLVDSLIVKVNKENNNYTKYKDAEEIPTYARAAVSNLYDAGIIETFADSEFKPNNPIVRDEFYKIIAKASEYMSSEKLKVKEPTFIYTDIVDDEDKTLNDNTKYIMELIRQNIIEKADTNPDEYILRKDAVEIINALSFRGPYVKDLGNNKVEFVDLKEDNKYFYNIIGASKTYTYNYSESLEQKILEIK